jgi:hypothetical protein
MGATPDWLREECTERFRRARVLLISITASSSSSWAPGSALAPGRLWSKGRGETKQHLHMYPPQNALGYVVSDTDEMNYFSSDHWVWERHNNDPWSSNF